MLSKVIVFIILISFTLSDEQVERGLNWYESLPAVAMDYKVHIDAGNFCYFFDPVMFLPLIRFLFGSRQGRLLSPVCCSRGYLLCLYAGLSALFPLIHLLHLKSSTWIFFSLV